MPSITPKFEGLVPENEKIAIGVAIAELRLWDKGEAAAGDTLLTQVSNKQQRLTDILKMRREAIAVSLSINFVSKDYLLRIVTNNPTQN